MREITFCDLIKKEDKMGNIVYLITGASGGIGSAIAKKISNSIEKGIIILH